MAGDVIGCSIVVLVRGTAGEVLARGAELGAMSEEPGRLTRGSRRPRRGMRESSCRGGWSRRG